VSVGLQSWAVGGGAAVSSAPGIGGGAAVSSAPGYRGRGCSLLRSRVPGVGLQSPYRGARGLAALAAAEALGLGASALASEKEKKTEEQLTRITQPERNTLPALIQNSTIPFQ
jgi:hypothetical protein